MKRTIMATTTGLCFPLVVVGGLALAQQRVKNANHDAADATNGKLVLMYPTGERGSSSMLVEVMSPAEVPVGRSYDYSIRVTNLTQNLVLQDVEIAQTGAEGFSVEKSKPEAKDGKDGGSTWTIDKLEPGQSRTIQVSALGDQEGMSRSCVKVHYEPTLCVGTRFVKPAIQVTKTAPERADVCRPLELRYAVKNTGTGVARDVILTDDLPKQLTSADGKQKIEQSVGDLQPGETKEYTVKVNASDTGEFGSRAVARSGEDLETRSKRPTTKIVASAIKVDLTGPKAHYLNQPMTYQAHVKNTGDGPAPDASLRIDVDGKCRIVSVSKTEPKGATPSESGNTLTWNLGDLDPSAERTVSFTVTTRGTEDLKHVAVATSACAAGSDRADMATDRKTIATNIIALPALVLEMVDEVDPVRVGDQQQYHIVVRNQGSGPDKDVQLKLELPEQFEFVSATGTTDVKANGQTLEFGTIDQLDAKAKASWNVRLKAMKAGDVRTKVELSSDYLKDPVPELEPTRVIE